MARELIFSSPSRGATARSGQASLRAQPAFGARGFTLIELVVVVTIVSVMSLGVVLGFGGGANLLPGVRASDPAGQAQRLEQAVANGENMALFGRETIGLQPLSSGWELLRFDAAAEAWEPVERSGPLELPLAWTIAGVPYPAPPERFEGTAPPIRLLGDGRLTRFSLRLGADEGGRICRAAIPGGFACREG